MSLWDILVKGGWLMIPIALSSVVVVALGINRLLIVRRHNRELEGFLREWEHRGRDPQGFISSAGRRASGISALISVWQDGGHNPRSEMESVARSLVEQLERGLGTLATLAAINPLMGFLGTVTGMIRAFMQIQNLGGNVNANVLAGGIWEALITTAAGLVVGIIAILFHNYLSIKVRQGALLLERAGEMAARQLGGAGL